MCVWTHGPESLADYFQYVNTVHPTIKFTIERSDTGTGTPGRLSCLDTLIKVKPDGHLTTELFIKPVAASIIIPFDSAQPYKMKKQLQSRNF